MTDAKPMSQFEEAGWRDPDAWPLSDRDIVARIWATLDAVRAEAKQNAYIDGQALAALHAELAEERRKREEAEAMSAQTVRQWERTGQELEKCERDLAMLRDASECWAGHSSNVSMLSFECPICAALAAVAGKETKT